MNTARTLSAWRVCEHDVITPRICPAIDRPLVVVTPRVLSAPRRVIPGRSSGGVAVGLLLLSAKITIKGKIVEFNGPDMRAVGWDNNLRIIGILAKQVYWDDGFHVGSVNHKHNRTLLNLGLCLQWFHIAQRNVRYKQYSASDVAESLKSSYIHDLGCQIVNLASFWRTEEWRTVSNALLKSTAITMT